VLFIKFEFVRIHTIFPNGQEIFILSLVCLFRELIGNIVVLNIGIFVFASAVNSFLTNVGKVSVGRLRPHFIPSCFNKFTYKDFCVDPTVWIANYTCIGESSAVVKEKDDAYDIR
jgi:hypothetical protein